MFSISVSVISMALGAFLMLMVIVLMEDLNSSETHVAEKAAREYNKLNRRLKYDSKIDLEEISDRMDSLKTEYLVHKPWYAFWINLEEK